ncbi:DUF2892 domain-containing protein [Lutibacter sp. A80]|uniref:YgaP family membrane protein n=1 Tax=Lutibacter sp. A80 TaxID=2918453 RepID=UPI001F062A16|nr:DUF2892 domain-containing protein [Lutibacter sp. A80]UMB60055.1 DUF2892 domain-containing protein [Lutibacter sp. A80]
MKLNIGSTDRIIRIMLGIAIGYFAYSTVIETSWVQVLLYVIAAILVITALIGNCPLYSIFKINTCKIKE